MSHPDDRREPFIKFEGNRRAGPFLLMLIMVFSMFYSTGAYTCKLYHWRRCEWKWMVNEQASRFDGRWVHDDGNHCIVKDLGINGAEK